MASESKNDQTFDLESQGKLLEQMNIDGNTWGPHINLSQAPPGPEIAAAKQDRGFLESQPRSDKLI